MDNAKRAEFFRQRLEKCMEDAGYTKNSLAKKLNIAYGTGYTHNDVRRWLNTGMPVEKSTINNKNGFVRFPKFETIMNLASFFNVDIGYLIGETSMQSFSMEKICEYTGLNDTAINMILKITGKEKSCLDFGYELDAYRSILNTLLSTEEFTSFIEELYKLDRAVSPSKNMWSEIESEVGKDLLEEAFTLYNSTTDYRNDPNAPRLKPELYNIFNMIDDVVCEQHDLSYSIKIARYELQKAFESLVESIYPCSR